MSKKYIQYGVSFVKPLSNSKKYQRRLGYKKPISVRGWWTIKHKLYLNNKNKGAIVLLTILGVLIGALLR